MKKAQAASGQGSASGPGGSSDSRGRSTCAPPARFPGTAARRGARRAEAGEWVPRSPPAIPAPSGPGLERQWMATRQVPRDSGPPAGRRPAESRGRTGAGRRAPAPRPCAARCRGRGDHTAAEGTRLSRPAGPSLCRPGL